MFFELQLSAGVFTRIVRNRLKAVPLCIDHEFDDPDGSIGGVPGGRIVVDRIVIGRSTWIQREQWIDLSSGLPQARDSATQNVWIRWPTNYTSFKVPFLQVKQELIIHLVRAADLATNGPQPTTPVRTFTVHLVINVALNASNQTQGGGPLTLSYSVAYIDYGVLFLVLSAAQRAEIAQFATGLTLPPTTLDLGPLTAVLRRPVAAINAGITCDESGSFVVLRADFDINASPVAVEPEFFRVSQPRLHPDSDWAMLLDRDVLLAHAASQSKDALTSDSRVKLLGGPHVKWNAGAAAIEIGAEAELVDACPFFIDDIDMDVDIDIRASFGLPAPDTLQTRFYLSGEASDLGEEILCALTGALLWPFIGPLFLKGESTGAGIGGYFAGLAGGPLLVFIGILHAIETSKMSKDISSKLGGSCHKVDDENYECNELLNLVMELTPGRHSRLQALHLRGDARGLVIGGAITNLRDIEDGELVSVRVCPFAWQIGGRCTGNGQSNFRIINEASISVTGRPDAALCHARILDDPQGEFVLTRRDDSVIVTPLFTPGYRAAPYPCRIRLITRLGVRTVTLAAPARLGTAEAERLENERLSAHLACYFWEKLFNPVEKIRWRPDPPFDRRRHLHLWQIAVRGLEADESIRIALADGERLMHASPSPSGVAHMTLLLDGERPLSDLHLELLGERRREEGRREMTTQQVLYVHRVSLPVGSPLRGLRFERGTHGRILVLDDGERIVTWVLDAGPMPVLLSSLPAACRDDRDFMLAHNGKRVGEPSQRVRRALERICDRFGSVDAVGSPRVGGVTESLYVRSGRAAILYDIADLGNPREVHVYEGPAWYENVALGGGYLVRYEADGGMLELFGALRRPRCS